MNFDYKRLMECDEPFFGIRPGKAAYPMGRVFLPVTFRLEENFLTEYLSFEVANFKSSYHTILGCPMLVRFMVIPHYTYLVLKMPAPRGVHYVKTSNRSRNICNGPLTPVTSTQICNRCSLAPVTYKHARTTWGWPPQLPLPM
jgi:hypothetical protein